MEDILQNVSNPYRIENYERLLNIYLNSKDYREFYASVVSYYNDRDYNSELEGSNFSSKFLKSRYMGCWKVMNEFSGFFKTEHRIYINAPLNYVGTIVDKFITECEDRNLPFELKYLIQKIERNDSIVIGSNTESYEKHIEILRQIASENPEIVTECGTPPMLTGRLDNWLGLADENVSNRFVSYTESRLKVFSKSINKYLYEHQDIIKEVEDEWILSINEELSFLDDFEDEKEEELDYSLDSYHLKEESKRKLNEYINQNPDVINELYEGFLSECDKRDIDPKSPTLYKGSRQCLLESKEKSNVSITDEVREKIQTTSATNVTNMYLGNDNRENLTIESRIEIMKTIIEKSIRDRYEEINAYEDLKFLNTIGLVSDDVINEVNQTLYSKSKLDLLYQYNEQQTEIFPDFPPKDKTLKQILESNDPILSDEQMKQKIDERRQSIIEYFKTPIVTEQIENQIGYEDNIFNKYKKDREFPYELKHALEIHNNLLKDDINQLPEKKEAKRKVCNELQDKNINDIDIKMVLDKIEPKRSKSDFEDIWL